MLKIDPALLVQYITKKGKLLMLKKDPAFLEQYITEKGAIY